MDNSQISFSFMVDDSGLKKAEAAVASTVSTMGRSLQSLVVEMDRYLKSWDSAFKEANQRQTQLAQGAISSFQSLSTQIKHVNDVTTDMVRGTQASMAAYSQSVATAQANVSRFAQSFTGLNSSILATGQALSTSQVRAQEWNSRIAAASTMAGQFNDKLLGISFSLQTLGALMAGLGAGLAAPLAASVVAAISFEKAFSDVKKTVEGTDEQLDKVAISLRNLSREIPVTANELAKIAALGGQMGIGVENIVKFTEVVAKMAATTNLSAESAARGLATLSSIMQEPIQNIDRMASAIVDLGNKFVATESDIITFAERIAGAGKIAGLTTADVLGIATAFRSVGVQAEAGGTAVQRMLVAMTQAVAQGGESLRVFAQVSGQTVEQFQAMFKSNPAKAFEEFVRGLKMSGDQAFGVLEQLFGSEARMVRAFISMSNAGDILTKAINQSSIAFKDNVAMQEEFEKKSRTVSAQLQILANKAVDVGIEIGNMNLPLVRTGVAFASWLLDLAKANPLITGLAVEIGGLVGAMGIATGGFLVFLGMIGRSIEGIKAIGTFLGPGFLTTAAAAVFSTTGLLVAGVIAAGVAMAIVLGHLRDINAEHQRLMKQAGETPAKIPLDPFRAIAQYLSEEKVAREKIATIQTRQNELNRDNAVMLENEVQTTRIIDFASEEKLKTAIKISQQRIVDFKNMQTAQNAELAFNEMIAKTETSKLENLEQQWIMQGQLIDLMEKESAAEIALQNNRIAWETDEKKRQELIRERTALENKASTSLAQARAEDLKLLGQYYVEKRNLEVRMADAMTANINKEMEQRITFDAQRRTLETETNNFLASDMEKAFKREEEASLAFFTNVQKQVEDGKITQIQANELITLRYGIEANNKVAITSAQIAKEEALRQADADFVLGLLGKETESQRIAYGNQLVAAEAYFAHEIELAEGNAVRLREIEDEQAKAIELINLRRNQTLVENEIKAIEEIISLRSKARDVYLAFLQDEAVQAQLTAEARMKAEIDVAQKKIDLMSQVTSIMHAFYTNEANMVLLSEQQRIEAEQRTTEMTIRALETINTEKIRATELHGQLLQQQSIMVFEATEDWTMRMVAFFGFLGGALAEAAAQFGTTWQQMGTLVREFASASSSALSDLFFNVFTGQTDNLGAIFEQMLQRMLRALANFLADAITQQFLNFLAGTVGIQTSGGGGIGGALGTALGGVLGTSNVADTVSEGAARALNAISEASGGPGTGSQLPVNTLGSFAPPEATTPTVSVGSGFDFSGGEPSGVPTSPVPNFPITPTSFNDALGPSNNFFSGDLPIFTLPDFGTSFNFDAFNTTPLNLPAINFDTFGSDFSFAEGGWVPKIGASGDIIPARLSSGEFVVNANSAEAMGPILEAFNAPGAENWRRILAQAVDEETGLISKAYEEQSDVVAAFYQGVAQMAQASSTDRIQAEVNYLTTVSRATESTLASTSDAVGQFLSDIDSRTLATQSNLLASMATMSDAGGSDLSGAMMGGAFESEGSAGMPAANIPSSGSLGFGDIFKGVGIAGNVVSKVLSGDDLDAQDLVSLGSSFSNAVGLAGKLGVPGLEGLSGLAGSGGGVSGVLNSGLGLFNAITGEGSAEDMDAVQRALSGVQAAAGLGVAAGSIPAIAEAIPALGMTIPSIGSALGVAGASAVPALGTIASAAGLALGAYNMATLGPDDPGFGGAVQTTMISATSLLPALLVGGVTGVAAGGILGGLGAATFGIGMTAEHFMGIDLAKERERNFDRTGDAIGVLRTMSDLIRGSKTSGELIANLRQPIPDSNNTYGGVLMGLSQLIGSGEALSLGYPYAPTDDAFALQQFLSLTGFQPEQLSMGTSGAGGDTGLINNNLELLDSLGIAGAVSVPNELIGGLGGFLASVAPGLTTGFNPGFDEASVMATLNEIVPFAEPGIVSSQIDPGQTFYGLGGLLEQAEMTGSVPTSALEQFVGPDELGAGQYFIEQNPVATPEDINMLFPWIEPFIESGRPPEILYQTGAGGGTEVPGAVLSGAAPPDPFFEYGPSAPAEAFFASENTGGLINDTYYSPQQIEEIYYQPPPPPPPPPTAPGGWPYVPYVTEAYRWATDPAWAAANPHVPNVHTGGYWRSDGPPETPFYRVDDPAIGDPFLGVDNWTIAFTSPVPLWYPPAPPAPAVNNAGIPLSYFQGNVSDPLGTGLNVATYTDQATGQVVTPGFAMPLPPGTYLGSDIQSGNGAFMPWTQIEWDLAPVAGSPNGDGRMGKIINGIWVGFDGRLAYWAPDSPFPQFHEGGWVGGMGNVPAMLQGGEFIVNRDAAASAGPMLESINGGGGGMSIGDINITVNGNVDDPKQLAHEIVEAIANSTHLSGKVLHGVGRAQNQLGARVFQSDTQGSRVNMGSRVRVRPAQRRT